MYSQITAIVLALAATPLVSAHGKIAAVTGNLGGNGTALGIKGAVIPGSGPNSVTEPDTTVFWSKDINTDNDLGYVVSHKPFFPTVSSSLANNHPQEDGSGNNQLADVASAMTLSGSTLPQVSSGGSVSGTFHVVTSDGCGPLEAVIDETATAKFSTASKATVTTEMPGSAGNCPASLSNDSGNNKVRRSLRRALVKMGLLSKRADNVNKDYVSLLLFFGLVLGWVV